MKKSVLIILSILFVGDLFAQGPVFSGYIESTYNYNLSGGMINSLRSYDYKANQILLNNFHFAVNGSPSEKVNYVAELNFGTDATVHGLLNQGIFSSDSPIGVDIQEAYLSYAFSDKFKFTGGRFVTFEGIEVIEGPNNPTISRGYLYGLAEPYTHVGGYFNFIPSSEIDIKLGVVNGWDLLVDNNMDKTIIGRFGVNLGDPLAFGISFLTGVEQINSENWRSSFDLTGVTKVISGVALNFQGNYGSETFTDTSGKDTDTKWFGFTLQPVITISQMFDFGLRAEYFADDQGARTGIPNLNAFNISVVPIIKYDGFTFRFEYRFDKSNKEVYVEEKGTAKSSSTVSFGVSCIL
jgi:hypothetical protein